MQHQPGHTSAQAIQRYAHLADSALREASGAVGAVVNRATAGNRQRRLSAPRQLEATATRDVRVAVICFFPFPRSTAWLFQVLPHAASW